MAELSRVFPVPRNSTYANDQNKTSVCQDLQDDQFYRTKRQYFKESKHREVTHAYVIERMLINLL